MTANILLIQMIFDGIHILQHGYCFLQLGVVYLEQGRKAEAFHQFEKALKHNPKHKQALFNSAVLRQEIGDPKLRPEAYKR